MIRSSRPATPVPAFAAFAPFAPLFAARMSAAPCLPWSGDLAPPPRFPRSPYHSVPIRTHPYQSAPSESAPHHIGRPALPPRLTLRATDN